MSALTWERYDFDGRPIYGPSCPGPHIHRWVLRVEDETVSLSSGCEECDGFDLCEVLAEVPGRAAWEDEHPVGHCPSFLDGPCDHASWLRFTPEQEVSTGRDPTPSSPQSEDVVTLLRERYAQAVDRLPDVVLGHDAAAAQADLYRRAADEIEGLRLVFEAAVNARNDAVDRIARLDAEVVQSRFDHFRERMGYWGSLEGDDMEGLARDLLAEVGRLTAENERIEHLGDTMRDAAYAVGMRLHHGELPSEAEAAYLARSAHAWTDQRIADGAGERR
ncbi:MAG TPA: hypothetical protein VGW74_06975 [Propionibacteriaceae bacterium]|nr:hypothetical protein [Propionibacteriaceae bacterium]